jgi:hypothetical protein
LGLLPFPCYQGNLQGKPSISAVLLISASQNMPVFKDLRPNSLFMKTGNFFPTEQGKFWSDQG